MREQKPLEVRRPSERTATSWQRNSKGEDQQFTGSQEAEDEGDCFSLDSGYVFGPSAPLQMLLHELVMVHSGPMLLSGSARLGSCNTIMCWLEETWRACSQLDAITSVQLGYKCERIKTHLVLIVWIAGVGDVQVVCMLTSPR